MLIDLFPRAHARHSSLPLLGRHLDDFAATLCEQGFSRGTIRLRLHGAPRLDGALRRSGVRDLGDLASADLLRFAPARAVDDKHYSALVRSLAVHLGVRGLLRPPPASRIGRLADAYRDHLLQVHGLARRTADSHAALARELLSVLGFEDDASVLCRLGSLRIEAFMEAAAGRQCRATLANTAARLRSFLRFLADRHEVPRGLDAFVDGPVVYQGERLPRALPWDAVRALLDGVDRSAAAGRRDYAMLLLAATYGLRAGEVAALQLDDLHWRSAKFVVRSGKTGRPFVLPFVDHAAAAVVDYLRNERPAVAHRAVFLRVRPPVAALTSSALWSVFEKWRRRCGVDVPHGGFHCLRHSLAMRLLRRDASLKAIGDVLGHRSPASTATYLRLSADDLRAAALDLPPEEAR